MRVQLASLGPGVVINPIGRPIANITGTITLHGTTTPAAIWSLEVGGTADTSGAFTTDQFGRIPGWVEADIGRIDIRVSPAPLITFDITAAVVGAPQSLDQLGANADVSVDGFKIVALGDPANPTDALNIRVADGRYDASGTASVQVAIEEARALAAEAAKLTASNNLSDLTNAPSARTSLGLGSAALANTSAFDVVGAASTEATRAQAAEALAAAKAANLSDLASATAARSNIGLAQAVVATRYLSPSGSDDTATFQSAVNAGGTLVLAPGTYNLHSGFFINNPVIIRGYGSRNTILNCSDVTGVGQAVAAVAIEGTRGTFYNVTQSINENDLIINLSPTDAANFAPGDTMFIKDPVYGASFTTRVLSVSGGQVTLEDRIPMTGPIADAPSVAKMVCVENVVLSDLTVQVTYGVTPALNTLVSMVFHQNCAIQRCRFRMVGPNFGPTNCSPITIRAGRELSVIGCEVDNWTGNEPNIIDTLGINVNNTTGFIAIGNQIRRSQCGICLAGCPQSVIIGNQSWGYEGTIGRPIKILDQSNYTTCIGNVVSGHDGIVPGTNTTTGTGIHCLDSYRCTIVGNTVRNTNCGGIIVGRSIEVAPNVSHHCVVASNNISFTGLGSQPTVGFALKAAVQIGASGQSSSDQTYCNVIGNNCFDTDGIQIWTSQNLVSGNMIDANSHSRCTNPSLLIHLGGGASTGNTFTGNAVRNGGAVVELDTSTSGGGANTVINNDVGAGLIAPSTLDSLTIARRQITLGSVTGALVTFNATTTNGSTVLTAVDFTNLGGLRVGTQLTGTNLHINSVVQSFDSVAQTITMAVAAGGVANATGSGSVIVTATPVTVTIDATLGTDFVYPANTPGTIILPPLHPASGLLINIEIANSINTTTFWDASFHIGQWVEPVAGKRRIIQFRYNGNPGFWSQVSLTPGDF